MFFHGLTLSLAFLILAENCSMLQLRFRSHSPISPVV